MTNLGHAPYLSLTQLFTLFDVVFLSTFIDNSVSYGVRNYINESETLNWWPLACLTLAL